MGEDEAGTAQGVRERHAVAEAMEPERSGRLFKTMGDALFIEFPSVVAAVECAVAIQGISRCLTITSPGARLGLCVVPSEPSSKRALTGLEQNENNFLAKIEDRATIARLSADRSLVEVAASSDEAREGSENCGPLR